VRVVVATSDIQNQPADRDLELDCDCDTDCDPDTDSDADTGRTPHPPQPRQSPRPQATDLFLRFCGFAQKQCLHAFASSQKCDILR
jgi:hypothetical protein